MKMKCNNGDMVIYHICGEIRVGEVKHIADDFAYIVCFTDKWCMNGVSKVNILEV